MAQFPDSLTPSDEMIYINNLHLLQGDMQSDVRDWWWRKRRAQRDI